ncbi:MAG: two-component system, OmpR family, sensor kinase [Micromonosporaceae bacterium]
MWATLSPSTNRRLVVAWATFAGINVVLMYLLPGQETVPFHFVWISLALVYGFTSWRTSWMVAALVLVIISTGVILAHHAATGEIRWEETTEEPLMSAIFAVMVWHVNRRQLLIREVQRVHELDGRRSERQQLFVRLASHELRTPITVARGYTELVRAAHSDEETLEDTEVVLDELDKVAGITQRLVTLMQLDEPHPVRRVDIDNELLRLVRRWAPTAEREWSVRSAIGDVLISPDRFEAALDCLVENAIKFTKPGQRIEVIGARGAGSWMVEVRDHGVGIATETARGLLANPPGQGTGTGTGLGLAIVRAVAESLDGRITISGAPGEGTAVTVVVPQAPLDPGEQAPREAVTARATGPGSRR